MHKTATYAFAFTSGCHIEEFVARQSAPYSQFALIVEVLK
jgi:hypothetical protein